MNILERLESNSRKALVQCPSCLSTRLMDYHKAKQRQATTDVCQSCTVAKRNKSKSMVEHNFKRIDEYVQLHNSTTNKVTLLRFTDKRERCLMRCNVCSNEYETRYRSNFFIAKGCPTCVKKLPKRIYEHSLYYTPRLASIYNTLIQRVTNPKRTTAIKYYRDKGITICQEWLNDRESFFKWAHENNYSEELTIDRINSNKNYEPSNCRWTTKSVQARNTARLQANNTSGYRGVSITSNNQWRARITVNWIEILIGVFDTAREAALAYDNYVLTHKLEHTRNFN